MVDKDVNGSLLDAMLAARLLIGAARRFQGIGRSPAQRLFQNESIQEIPLPVLTLQ